MKYVLTRKRDGLVNTGNTFKNIRYKVGGNSITEFPPEVGCGVIVYELILGMLARHWHTTLIKSIEKISDDEYTVFTDNSEYNLKRICED